jgi:hypothetical protein
VVDLTPEQIDDLAARDGRVAALRLAIDLETDLRDNGPLHKLMAVLRSDADGAIDAFAVVNPADTQAVIDLQARVFRFAVARNTFSQILATGKAAEDDLRANDP